MVPNISFQRHNNTRNVTFKKQKSKVSGIEPKIVVKSRTPSKSNSYDTTSLIEFGKGTVNNRLLKRYVENRNS